MSIAWFMERLSPGIWAAFIGAANAGLLRGSRVTSWWRSPTSNRRVGGDPDSQHLVGLAFDAVHPDQTALSQSLSSQGFIVSASGGGAVHAQALRAGVLRSHGVFSAIGL